MKKYFHVLAIIVLFSGVVFGKDNIYQLKYISPEGLIDALQLDQPTQNGYQIYLVGGEQPTFLRMNYFNNQVLLEGANIDGMIDLIKFYDIPPRQIIIEVSILEVNNQKLDNLGLDWDALLEQMSLSVSMSYSNADYNDDDSYSRVYDYEDYDESYTQTQEGKADRDQKSLSLRLGTLSIGEIINIMREKGTVKIVNAPRIVTTNNCMGSIMDGSHTTFVSRYSSYSNLYETQDMNTGLSLQVIPSIGESDYLYLDVEAKYTSMLVDRYFDSPIEEGQILKNKIIARNDEPFLLGAFKRTQMVKVSRKVPLLGTILPFLFSIKDDLAVTNDVLIVLTPKVIDLVGSIPPEME